jgi:integrase
MRCGSTSRSSLPTRSTRSALPLSRTTSPRSRSVPRQAELALRLLKQILANAKERGHLVDDGVFRVKAPRRQAQEMRFLEWAEVEELAANTAAPYGNMVMLAALTGLRQGELFALRDRNVDLDAKVLIIENGVYKGEFWPVKTRASRGRVDLSATAVRVLRRSSSRANRTISASSSLRPKAQSRTTTTSATVCSAQPFGARS